MRAILAFVVIVALTAAAVLFTENPGDVEILWQGWQIKTSVGVLVAAAALAALAVTLVVRLVSLTVGTPGAFLRRRRERRRRAGYQALTRGMVAVAAGDPQEAQRYARRAEVLLAEPPLTLLLSAQAAQIGGDEQAAKNFFTAMLDRPETELLGLRGLFNQALRGGDREAARHLARRAAELRPNTAWAALSLFDLEARGSCNEATLPRNGCSPSSPRRNSL
jgi:HemY protein